MSSVPQHRHASWWSFSLAPDRSETPNEFDDPKPIVESLLRDLSVQGKLTPETIQ